MQGRREGETSRRGNSLLPVVDDLGLNHGLVLGILGARREQLFQAQKPELEFADRTFQFIDPGVKGRRLGYVRALHRPASPEK